LERNPPGFFSSEPVAVGFVIASGEAALDEDALRDWCRARLASYKVPRRIFSIDEFPTTPSANGTKIQRTRLRQLAIERCA
jgi:fatty-acyl-CoA synthase